MQTHEYQPANQPHNLAVSNYETSSSHGALVICRIRCSNVHDIRFSAGGGSLKPHRHRYWIASIGEYFSVRWLAARPWIRMAIDKYFNRCDRLTTRKNNVATSTIIIGMFRTSAIAHFNLCIHVFTSGSIGDRNCCTENIWPLRCYVWLLGNFGSILWFQMQVVQSTARCGKHVRIHNWNAAMYAPRELGMPH